MRNEEDKRLPYGEQRLQSLGYFRNQVVFLVWTDREVGPHVISCRYGLKASDRGWQTRVNEAMREWLKTHSHV
jgi:uncharacterized DUF497 family protein